MIVRAAAVKKPQSKLQRFLADVDQVRRLLAIIAAVLGLAWGYWKAGLVGALLAGSAAGAAMLALVTLVPVGISIAVVLLALVFCFVIYALIYHAINGVVG